MRMKASENSEYIGYSPSNRELIKILKKLYKKVERNKTSCMHCNCEAFSIQSHVFQKSTILKSISKENKIYVFEQNLFDSLLSSKSERLCYKKRGINESFSFLGFCAQHDNCLFASIEPQNGKVDWSDIKNQYLLAYRTLCRELYTKRKALSFFIECNNNIKGFPFTPNLCKFINDTKSSIKLLEQHKKILELGISEEIYSKYEFNVIKLPFRLELCVAATIALRTGYFPDNENFIPECNIIDIFPQDKETIVIMEFLKDMPNRWMNKIYKALSSNNSNNISKALQDILFRTDFHCISENLYRQIGEDTTKEFIKEWDELKANYNEEIQFKSNMFNEVLRNLMRV